MDRPVTALVCAAWTLAACQPSNASSTMDLLRAGDGGVCIANDVEDTLRQLIKPKGASTAAYSINFADTSLASFDKAVSRATCNTFLSIDGADGTVVERTAIDYVLTPSSQNPSTFIVTADVQPFQEQLRSRIQLDAAIREEDAEKRQEREELAALVKPAWLIGRWYIEESGSQACSSGPYEHFARAGRYDTGALTGRWRLVGLTLTTILPTSSEEVQVFTAGSDYFTTQNSDGDRIVYQRCSPAEMRPIVVEQPSGALTDDLAEAEGRVAPPEEQ